MNVKTFLPLAAIAVMASCTGAGKETATPAAEEPQATASADLAGKWNLVNIVLSDTVNVRPAEAVPDAVQYIEFTDSTYFIQTNCNTISGPLTVNGDSVTLGAGPATRMACENMATEDALYQVLPLIQTVDVVNDSVVRLNSADASKYIVLGKASKE